MADRCDFSMTGSQICAPEHPTGDDQRPLDLAVLVNEEGSPCCVVNEGAVFGGVSGVGDRCQLAVDVETVQAGIYRTMVSVAACARISWAEA